MTHLPPPGTGGESPRPNPAIPPAQPYPAQPYPAAHPPIPPPVYGPPAHPYGYAVPYAFTPYPPSPPMEGMAIASLAVSCAAGIGLCAYGVGGLLGFVGAILGHVARHRVRASGAGGDGMALAGIVVGWITAGIGVLAVTAIVLLIVLNSTTA